MEDEFREGESEAVRFLQDRVARFALTSGMAGLLLVGTWVLPVLLLNRTLRNVSWPGLAFLAAGSGVLLLVALATRRVSPSLSYVHKLEATGLLLACGCLVVGGAFLSPDSWPGDIVGYLLLFAIMARSIYVPSRGRRTLALGVAVAVLHVPLAVWVYPRRPFHWSGSGTPLGYPQDILFGLVTIVVGWVLVISMSTAASEVIYGLRQKVGQAQRLGPYSLVRKIGEGGMGEVWEAGHAMLRRRTAVKLLLPTKASEDDILRFEREVRLSARLCHPNTITIYDFGRTRGGVFYYAMELLDGASLERLVDFEGPVHPGRAARILHAVAGALRETHGLGLIHRDIKPANILLCRHGGEYDVPKLVDFGLVKSIRKGAASPLSTESDVMLGTPYYMSPEAIRHPESVDARSDLYSLGAVAFYLVTGTHLFSGAQAFEVCERHVHQEPDGVAERLGRPFPADFEALILDCLRKGPAERPQSAAVLRRRLGSLACFDSFGESEAEAWWRDRGAGFLDRTRPTDRGGLLAWADAGLASSASVTPVP